MARTTPGINKQGGGNVNPLYKAVDTVTKYVGNVGKELKDYQNSSKVTDSYSYKASNYPPDSMASGGAGRETFGKMANTARKNQDKAAGQLWGAVLQGRRYDKKGKVK